MSIATEGLAGLLASVRRGAPPLPGLPEALRPASVAEAEAVQRATFATLGLTVGGWKIGRAGDLTYAAPLPAQHIAQPSAVLRLPARAEMELEIALRLRREIPLAELARLDPAALPDMADLILLFEFVDRRFAPGTALGPLERIADCVANHAVVAGPPTGAWSWPDVEQPRARLLVDGTEIARLDGPHPAWPVAPLLLAWRDRCRREAASLPAGPIVTLGSLTGVLPIPPRGGLLRGEVEGRGAIACRLDSPLDSG